MFSKYDRGNKGGLDVWDVGRMMKGQRLVMDFFGWAAVGFECKYRSVSDVGDSGWFTDNFHNRACNIFVIMARRWSYEER
jgi:hypothetical protein